MLSNRQTRLLVTLTVLACFAASPAAATAPTPVQQKCITSVNKDAARVARAQSGNAGRCIKSAGRGLLGGQTAQECVEADNTGKVGLAKAKTLADAVKSCGTPPDFGYTGGANSNTAAEAETRSLVADVYGAPLENAILTAAGAKCQERVAKAFSKLQQTKLKEFQTCKKNNMKGGNIDSTPTLENCIDAISLDVKQKVAKAQAKLLSTISGSGCFASSESFNFAALFAGECSGSTAAAGTLATCVDRVVECRVCRHINLVDATVRDCDLFDDGIANATCDTTIPACDDGILNQDETDVDCGGATCLPCGDGDICIGDGDCESSVCLAGVCQAPTCSDGTYNQDETDVDCGGSCPSCPDGGGCVNGGDCQSSVCMGNICVAASCADLIQNGTETGVDCGGGGCPPCPPGGGCASGVDCTSGVCISMVCQPPTCIDGLQNGTESDVDCGGTCPGCPDGDECNTGADCQSGVCSGGNICLAPSCTDLVENGAETDVDCGGGTCPDCGLGGGCTTNSDCVVNICSGGECTCGNQAFTFTVNSNSGGVFDSAEWPGGTSMQSGLAGCSVTIKRPSGNIDLAGLLGDDFEIQSFAGYSNCFGTGGEDGDGCQPDSCPPVGIPYCEARRPSCTAALNGSGSARFFVQCLE